MLLHRLVPGMLACALLGLALGSTPVIKDHTRYYAAEFVPVSGFLFGMLAAGLQVKIAKRLRAPVVAGGVWILAVGSLVGYLFIDVGRYVTGTVIIRDRNGAARAISLSETLTFGEFVWAELQMTAVERPHGRGIARRFNRAQSTVLYLIDLSLCFGMAGFIAGQLASKCSFCRACCQYEIMTPVAVIPTTSDRSLRKEMLQDIASICRKGDEVAVGEHLADLFSRGVPPGTHPAKLVLEKWRCPQCEHTTSRVTYQVLGGAMWVTNGMFEIGSKSESSASSAG